MLPVGKGAAVRQLHDGGRVVVMAGAGVNDATIEASDLWRREITVRGKGGRPRVVRIGHEAARALDRYLRARSRYAQAHRPQLWLG